MQAIGPALPLTHGVEAAREIVGGAAVSEVGGLLLAEVAVGATYALVGAVLLRVFELESRRTASLETF